MATSTFYFERLELLLNGEPGAIDSNSIFRVSVTSDIAANPVNGMEPEKVISGVTTGNLQAQANISSYIKSNIKIFDWRSIDYDQTVVNIACFQPVSNYALSVGGNVFDNATNYLLLSGCYLNRADPLNAPGVGQAVSQEIGLIIKNWQWVIKS